MIKVILWDIDGTLLNFKKSESYAIKKCFEIFDMGECTDEMVQSYSIINHRYWESLERGEITKKQVLIGRFKEFFEKEGLPIEKAEPFNDEYQIRLGDKVFFNDNGEQTVKVLKENKIKQYAVTNGTYVAQKRKLAYSELDKIFDGAFISDEIGIEKPGIGFFEHVFKEIAKDGDYKKDEIMIVGDSLTSDMQGGNNAGILCCLYKPEGVRLQDNLLKTLKIDYEIRKIEDVLSIMS